MKSLCSNGPGSVGDWMGADTDLRYPGVDTCITVTCLVGSQLVGCHLFHHWRHPGHTLTQHDAALTTFATAAKKLGPVKAVYVIGNVGHWSAHLATLVSELKSKLGYAGLIGGSEPETCRGDLAVTLTPPVALVFTNTGVAVVLKLLAG